MRWLADRHPEIVALVAYLPLERPDIVASRLAELREDARAVGIRTLIHDQPRLLQYRRQQVWLAPVTPGEA